MVGIGQRSRVARCEEPNERPRPPLSVAVPGRAKLAEQDGLPVGPDPLPRRLIVGWVVALVLTGVLGLAVTPARAGAAQKAKLPKLTSAQLAQLDQKVRKGGTVTVNGRKVKVPGARLVRGQEKVSLRRTFAKLRRAKHGPNRVRFYRGPRLGRKDCRAGSAYNNDFINTADGCNVQRYLAQNVSDFISEANNHDNDFFGMECPADGRQLGAIDDVSFGSSQLYFHYPGGQYLPVSFQTWIVGPRNNSWSVEVSLVWGEDGAASYVFRGGFGGGGYELILVAI